MASSTAPVPHDTEQPATRAMDVDDDEARLVAPVAGAGATMSASQSGGRSSSTTYSKRKPMCMLGVITMAVIVPVAILLGVALAPSPECPHCVIPKFPHFAVPKQTVQPVATTPTVPGVKNRKPQMECHGMAEAPQIIVVRGADVYTPEHLGVRDIVVAGNTIVGIYTSGSAEVAALSALGSDVVSLIDAEGLIATPGLVDIHVHLTVIIRVIRAHAAATVCSPSHWLGCRVEVVRRGLHPGHPLLRWRSCCWVASQLLWESWALMPLHATPLTCLPR